MGELEYAMPAKGFQTRALFVTTIQQLKDIFVSCLVRNKTPRLQTLFPLKSWLICVKEARTTVMQEHSPCCGLKSEGEDKAEMVPKDRPSMSPRGVRS